MDDLAASEDVDTVVKALDTLGKLHPASLAQYGDAVVARLDDSHEDVRDSARDALQTMGKLAPATLAQYAGTVVARYRVARLGDSEWDVRRFALETLGKLEPARLAQHAGAVIDTWLELHPNDENFDDSYLGRAEECASALALIRALPCYRDIDFVSVDMHSADVRSRLRSRLLARLRWYMYGLRLRVQRIALYWYALPYRPSGPGHSRDMVAWESMTTE